MANKRNMARSTSNIQSYLDDVNRKMDDLYQTTYSTSSRNRKDVRNMTQGIEDTIKQIIQRNPNTNVSSLTSMYSRIKLKKESNNKATIEQITDFFNNQNLTNGLLQDYMENRWIKELDDEIDVICNYMPKLEDALDILKYATLTSDNYSKDFLNVTTMNFNKEEEAVFANKFEALKKKYHLVEKVSDYYDKTSKYGECLVYRVPYSREIKNLLTRKDMYTKRVWDVDHTNNMMNHYHESVIINENGDTTTEPIFESSTITKLNLPDEYRNKLSSLQVIIDNRGFLESAIQEHVDLIDNVPEHMSSSLHEQFSYNINESSKLDKTIEDDLEIPEEVVDDTARDGLITKKTQKSNIGDVKVPGCIIRPLKRENMVFIYVEDICLGYYYFEFKGVGQGFNEFSTKLSSRTNLAGDANCAIHKKTIEDKEDYASKLLNYIAGYLAEKIDTSFVNKNEDLQDEIYAVLKHNDLFNDVSTIETIRVTFIPAEDVTHFVFKKDPITHRGISDLMRGLIPAKLACCLMLTDAIGNMTRGYDRRVYYVKQNIETNISQTLLNVISQIKKSNFGLRQIESMNNILNIIGRFNDYVIPVGQNGESPIQFEIMQGQQIETNTDLLDRLLDLALGGIVPRELIDTMRGIDFSSQITSTNIQFIRKIYSRQTILEEQLSEFFTCLYNYEYETQIQITCKLPAPIFLQMNNINQILQTNMEYAESLSQLEYDQDQSDEGNIKRAIFKKNLIRHNLSSYIKINEIDQIKQRSELEYESIKKPSEENM